MRKSPKTETKVQLFNKLTVTTFLSLALFASSYARVDTDAVEKALQSADTTAAQTTIAAAIDLDSKDFEALYWNGRIQYSRADWAGAIESFNSSLNAKKNYYQSLYHLALSQMHAGEFEQAESSLRKGSKKARTLRIEFKGAEDTLRLIKAQFAKSGGVAPTSANGSTNGSTAKAASSAVSVAATSEETEKRLKASIRKESGEVLNYFALGKFYYDNERFAEAKEQLEKGLKKKRNHELSKVYLGLTLIKQGELESARKLLEKALKRTKNFKAEFNAGLGELALEEARRLQESGAGKQEVFAKASEADTKFRIAINFDSTNATYRLGKADANFIRGVYPSAKAAYEQALADNPGSASILIKYAQACYEIRDFSCALEQSGKVIALDSSNSRAWRMAGSINYGAAVASRDQDDAIAKYRNSIAAYRKYQELTNAVADSSNIQIYYEIATALSRLGGHEEALKNYEEVLGLGLVPKDIYFSMAKAYTGLKKWDEAIDYYNKHKEWVAQQDAKYKKTLKKTLKDSELDRRIGDAYYNKKEYVSALPYLTRSYQADTSQSRLLISISLSYHNLKEYINALPYYQKTLELDLGDQAWSIYLNAAYCALAIANGDGADDTDDEEMEEDEEAINAIPVNSVSDLAPSDYYKLVVEWLGKALELKPDNDKAITLLATTYLYDMNDCANGVAWYTKVHERNPGDCEALRSLGYAYFGGVCTNNFGKAIGYLGQALDCMGGDACSSPEISLWIAQAYHLRAADRIDEKKKEAAKADFKKAHEWYVKVLACDPGSTEAKEGKGQVQFEF